MSNFSWKHLAFDYGMLFVLFALCAVFSVATVKEQHPDGAAAGANLGQRLADDLEGGDSVLVVLRATEHHAKFGRSLVDELERADIDVLDVVSGDPSDARATLEGLRDAGRLPTAIAGPRVTMQWALFSPSQFDQRFPEMKDTHFFQPDSYKWPTFLMAENLINVATQIVVIAVIAIGMTMVIITGGIDLSVGSLIALSAATAAAVTHLMAGDAAPDSMSTLVVVLACASGVAVCTGIGLFTGLMVTGFSLPSFIVTLAVMLMARGMAYKVTGGQALGNLPDSFSVLGHGAIAGIPISVGMMAILFLGAHIIMTRTRFGRYVYAIGGNAEAALFSGIQVKRTLIIVYTLSGLLAGLGGIVMGSELQSGDPKTGQFYELYVIAAVVVGGAPLMGGRGKIFGTLIGAFIIGVIRNGMNLMNVNPFNQYIVFGLIILLAVLIENLKYRVWQRTL
jgi:ribose transport system permease protein